MGSEKPDWLVRLIDAADAYVAKHGSSLRSVSLAAGLHANFLTQLKAANWREPLFGNVVKLCQTIGVSVTYVVTGAELSQSQEEMLSALAPLSEEQQRSVLAFLRTFSPAQERIE